MERRGCGLGFIIALLGLVLNCFLLPYLISSIYSIVSSLLQVPVASTWLWGDWLNGVFGSNNTVYMILAEGPICCVGVVALLIAILGGVMMISGLGPRDEYHGEEEYEPSEELEGWYDEQD